MTTDNTEDSFQINSPAGTYNFFEDQVTLAGLIFPDSWLENYLDGNKRVFAMAVSPIESFNVSNPMASRLLLPQLYSNQSMVIWGRRFELLQCIRWI